jgi:putative aminopeptidase FrvX
MKKNNSINLIKDLSNANGVSGFEDQVLEVVRNKMAANLTAEVDSMRNMYLYPEKRDPQKPILMLDSHSDEVGFMVKSVNKNGSLKFVNLGRWFPQNIPAHKVRIRNSEGQYIKGIVASKPPHFMKDAEKDKLIGIDEMIIDIGASSKKETVEDYKIEVGAPIVPDVIMIGKAFDNRLGTAAVIDLLNELSAEELDLNLVGSLSAQEEVGTRGAEVTSRKIKADIAIAFEGTPADDTFRDQYDAQSPFQDAVRTGGGNDGAKITLSNYSVPTIVIGVPVRYAHTHYSISAYKDYENTISWAAEIIKDLDSKVINEF